MSIKPTRRDSKAKLERASCSNCCGSDPRDCETCGGTGIVNGIIPTKPGWYRVTYGDGSQGFLEVDNAMYVIVGDPQEGIHVGCANWHTERDVSIVSWDFSVEDRLKATEQQLREIINFAESALSKLADLKL